ncbi:MarR family transcriptional regulator [Spiractinospora alimapuensis]|uniref:MarR family winged helix-turn-helix transcriptional regulator n=1 Tax=Spiractinospora alimapuensis TaxID=2820884 RepID=UPI001F16642C|nr:winged helix DNA-binding protein [Spiractinospora alimapuensis]QVQ53151.1 MarR family transcriptional regulator [Spiractinospora alimapuensis]
MSSKLADESVLEFIFEVKSMIAELNPVLTRTFKELGLTCVQADALMALERLGPVTLKELATHLVAESGHPSRLIGRLDAEGLVTRAASPQDGRAVLITLTARGADLAAAARAARAPLLAEFAERFTEGRLDDATTLVREVRNQLEGH